MDLFLPSLCILCGHPSDAGCLCQACKSELPWTGTSCSSCGLPLGTSVDKRCGACISLPPPYLRTICPLRYEFPADRLVQAFKFRKQLTAGRILARFMCDYVISKGGQKPDTLIPVPLHGLRFMKRGFNQAHELAEHLDRSLKIPMYSSSLRRRRYTKAQSGLSRKQRRKNVHGAFYWHGSRSPGSHVALIDDVMTTGTTVGECTRVLKKAGAKQVDVWVAARAIPAARQ